MFAYLQIRYETKLYSERITGLEPVRAELNSAMLHQLHHIHIRPTKAPHSQCIDLIVYRTYNQKSRESLTKDVSIYLFQLKYEMHVIGYDDI